MILVVVGVYIIVEVCDIGQHTEIGIVQKLIGVHPEDVRHGVGFGGGFQLGPVLVPAGDLHVDDHIRVLRRVGVADGRHAVPLVDVPDLEGQVGLAVGGAAAAKAQQQREGQSKGGGAGNSFHNSTPLLHIRFGPFKTNEIIILPTGFCKWTGFYKIYPDA